MSDLITIPNPFLRKVAQPCRIDKRLDQTIEKLQQTMHQHGGIGIAAPQVGNSERLFIMSSHPNSRYPNAPTMEPTVMINPELLSSSNETEYGWEGCLSVPKKRGYVERSVEIAVRYIARDEKPHEISLSGFIARVFLHELDHLDGTLFIDRVSSPEHLIDESVYFDKVLNNL